MLAANDAGRAGDAKAHALVWAIATDKLKLAEAAAGDAARVGGSAIERMTDDELRNLVLEKCPHCNGAL